MNLRKSFGSKIVAFFALILATVGVAIPLVNFTSSEQAYAAGSCSVAVFSDFASCWAAQSSQTDIDITVTADITMTATITIPAGKNVTITSDIGQQRILTRGAVFTGNIFNVNSATANSLTLTNITIDGNGNGTPNVNGNLINLANSADSVTVGPGTILQNNYRTVGTTGTGGVYVTAGSLVVDGATIQNNKSPRAGGAISATNSNSHVRIIDAILINNVADTHGGGLYLGNGASAGISGNTIINGNSTVGGNGGGILADASSSLIIEDTLTVSNNTADASGGGISISNGSTLTNYGELTISGNTTTRTYGGGLYYNSTAQLILQGDVVVNNNTSNNHGGGAYFVSGSSVDTDSLDSLTVTNNSTITGNGGGLYLAGTAIDFPSATTISYNSTIGGCNRYAAGVYIIGASNVTFSGNAQITHNNASCYAGGIYIRDTSTVAISDNVNISNNIAGSNGGGVLTDSSTVNLTITDNVTVSNNQSGASGGGFRLAGANNVIITDNVQINGNTAVGAGGGISTYKGAINNFSISSQVQINNNHTDGSGGAINVNPYGGGTQIVNISDDVSISGNTAVLDGGGIAASGDGTVDIFVNVSGTVNITGNSSGKNGGGISVPYEKLPNLSIGAGVIFSDNSATTSNTIFSPSSDQAIYDATIFATSWTSPFVMGYNNYDISYTALKHTISFDTTGGNTISSELVLDGDTFYPPTPVRSGHTFSHWIGTYQECAMDGEPEEEVCTTVTNDPFDPSTLITQDWVLVAVWNVGVPGTGTLTSEPDGIRSDISAFVLIVTIICVTMALTLFCLKVTKRR